MDINFIFEIKKQKYILWNKKNINTKKYYFWNLDNINIQNNTHILLNDEKFDYQSQSFEYYNSKKITLTDIEKELSSFDIWKNIFLWYTIFNIKQNWKKSAYILWKNGKINYNIWIYTINQIFYNKIMKYFWKNIKINIFPSSFFLIKTLEEEIKNGTIVYMLDETTKKINIENWFYKSVESLGIWKKIFTDEIFKIFWKNIKSIENLMDFKKNVYEKELEKFLAPIEIFLKNNKNNIYIIWDFINCPWLINKIWKKIQSQIIPLKIDKKSFKKTEELEIYCYKKFN